MSHLQVRQSLELLGLLSRHWHHPVNRYLNRTAQRLGATGLLPHCQTRIIGVVREPFEMLVSLFEYWRDYPWETPQKAPFVIAAIQDNFCDFIYEAVSGRTLPTYEVLFDLNGPAWPTTRLLDFDNLQGGLELVCHEFGIPSPGALPRCNHGPRGDKDLELDRYKALAGPLMKDVQRYFGWYHKHASCVVVDAGRLKT